MRFTDTFHPFAVALLIGMSCFSPVLAMTTFELGPALRKQTMDLRLSEKSADAIWELNRSKDGRTVQVSSASNVEGHLFLKLRSVVHRYDREGSPEAMLRLENVRLSGGDKAFLSLRWNGLHRGGKYGNESWEIVLEQNIRMELMTDTELAYVLKRFSGDADDVQGAISVLIQP